jgi:hypothetical protein
MDGMRKRRCGLVVLKVDAVCMNRAIAFLSKEPCGYSVVALKYLGI